MNLAKYEQLTGTTVPESQQVQVKAQLKRAQTTLESMLGYSLSTTSINQYEELGKSTVDCAFDPLEEPLTDPDEVIGSYRLFPYRDSDVYLLTDPFTILNKVKLVFVKSGEEPNGVTIKTFDANDIRVNKRNGYAVSIQKDVVTWCMCKCKYGSVQLAVDAQWLNEDCAPDELDYLLVDMVNYEIDCDRNLKSESIGPHSKSFFETPNPIDVMANKAIIQKYAGPNGIAFIQSSL